MNKLQLKMVEYEHRIKTSHGKRDSGKGRGSVGGSMDVGVNGGKQVNFGIPEKFSSNAGAGAEEGGLAAGGGDGKDKASLSFIEYHKAMEECRSLQKANNRNIQKKRHIGKLLLEQESKAEAARDGLLEKLRGAETEQDQQLIDAEYRYVIDPSMHPFVSFVYPCIHSYNSCIHAPIRIFCTPCLPLSTVVLCTVSATLSSRSWSLSMRAQCMKG